MNATYKIRIQVVAAADDDGSNAATVTPALITSRLSVANQVFGPADVQFEFDEQADFLTINSTLHNRDFTPLEPPNLRGGKWDYKPLVDAASHSEARKNLAQQFPHKLVLFYRNRTKLAKDGKTGHWMIANKGGGSSSWSASYVNMSTSSGANDLAHEIGHYLQIPHPFVGGVDTVEDAANKIKAYVDAGHSKDEGLSALDGDRDWVLDTPADTAGAIFQDQGLTPCGSVGEIPIPVSFPDGDKTYTLAPDRTLIMSYFKNCPGPKTVSPEQARRIRDGLEMRLRHPLITTKPSFQRVLLRGGTATAGKIGEFDVALVRAGRIATALQDGSGNLKVIVWDIENSGNGVIRRGSAKAGAVGRIAACSLGLNMIATAVVDAGGTLKIIAWRIEDDGSVMRLGSAGRNGTITDVAACFLTRNHIATASRTSAGTLRLDAWYTPADGSVTHKATASAGKVNMLKSGFVTPRLVIHEAGQNSVVTHVRDEAHDLKTILWRYAGGKLSRLGSSSGEVKPVGALSGTMLARELGVAAFQDANKNLRLLAYRFPHDAFFMEQGGTTNAGTIGEVDACRLGTETVATAVRDSENNLKLIIWQVTKSGDQIVRRQDASTEEPFFRLALCPADRNQFVTALQDGYGNLKIIAWRLSTLLAGEIKSEIKSEIAR